MTGGASFIGSHLVDSLVSKGSIVRVVDDFSSGKLDNLQYPLSKAARDEWVFENLTVIKGDLKDQTFTRKVVEDVDIVFHLAASHGGRGYIDSHPADCASNLALDGIVFEEANRASVEKVCYASSACVYPTSIQNDGQNKPSRQLRLSEDMADPYAQGKANPDLEYGWAKLMGEMSLKAYHKQYGLHCANCRIFTAYGERENETHAIIALIAKAFVRMDPYEIWGTGEQDRNFTYVKDIVTGLILAAEKVDDGSPVNLGTTEHLRVRDVADKIFEHVDWRPKHIFCDESKPEGVFSRAADLTRAKQLLGWYPTVQFDDGLRRTIEWYTSTRDSKLVEMSLPKLLIER